jgi:hypothetical protein
MQANLVFRLKGMRFFSLRSAVPVTAFACMDCGSVFMNTDPELVAGMLKQEET